MSCLHFEAQLTNAVETLMTFAKHLLMSMPPESQEFDVCRHLDITVKKWDHSAHCAHLRSHPEEYVAALQAFLAKVTKADKD